jgi:hypothetical protein
VTSKNAYRFTRFEAHRDGLPAFSLRPPVRPRARRASRPFASALDDQLALEPVDRAEDMEDQPPVGVVVSMCCLRTHRADATLAQSAREREKVLKRPHGARQAGGDQHVALAQVGHGPVQLGAGGVLGGGGEDLVATVGRQVIDLAVVFWLRVDTRA